MSKCSELPKSNGSCRSNEDRSVSHFDSNNILTKITHQRTPTGRPKAPEMGYGPNAGQTYFGPKGGTKK